MYKYDSTILSKISFLRSGMKTSDSMYHFEQDYLLKEWYEGVQLRVQVWQYHSEQRYQPSQVPKERT